MNEDKKLKYVSYAIVFSEIPDEITLAFQITNCPFHCPHCHSPYLQEDIGKPLEPDIFDIISQYHTRITCVCFMGEGNNLSAICNLSQKIKQLFNLKTALYTGLEMIPIEYNLFDYIKVGPYIEEKGPLTSPTTNQKMYQYINNQFIDITYKFWRRHYENAFN